jgi:hypothetical protein
MDAPQERGAYSYTAFEGSGKPAEPTGIIGKTLRDNEAQQDELSGSCPKCDYRVRSNEKSCPNCGYLLESKTSDDIPKEEVKEIGKDSPVRADKNKTVNPWVWVPSNTQTCSLTLVAAENEKTDMPRVDFTGNEVILKRDNTEPDNLTITSKEQAALLYEDNKWFIEDRSEMRTTFIHAGEKKELKDGDIIILGNRRFTFNT